MNGKKSIHEKWNDSEITILPPIEPTKEEIKEALRDTDLSDDEKDKLLELLWEDLDVK